MSEMTMDEQLSALLAFVQADERVCPRPIEWNQFWQSLPGAQRTEHGFTPAAPLILAAWHGSSDHQKADRLREHIMWAAAHGALDEADQFLRQLPLEAWHHANPSKPNY
jgi:hypothetical protein